MAKSYVGQQFTTSNSTVKTLPEGAVIQKVGSNLLEVVELPVKEFAAGDRIQTKYGPGTVVGLSSRFSGVEGFDPEEQVLYIADNSFKVRAAYRSNLQ